MKPNAIRDKAQRVCRDPDGAKATWQAVMDDHPGASARQLHDARLAMLKVVADGGSIEEGEKAAREVLS